MNKILLLFFLGVFCFCSNDESLPEEENSFFNLTNGNLWVYKKYNFSQTEGFTVTNVIDSVSIVGDTTLAGINYSIRRHKYSPQNSISDEYVRVDSNGHLINSAGIVVHPGEDLNYSYVRNFYDMGNITYQLQNPITVEVEGNSYYVYPFIGQYVPFNTSMPNQSIYDQYQKNLGLICQRCTSASGTSTFEYRLVYTNVE